MGVPLPAGDEHTIRKSNLSNPGYTRSEPRPSIIRYVAPALDMLSFRAIIADLDLTQTPVAAFLNIESPNGRNEDVYIRPWQRCRAVSLTTGTCRVVVLSHGVGGTELRPLTLAQRVDGMQNHHELLYYTV